MTGFLELLDRNYALSHFIRKIPVYLSNNQKELSNLLKIYNKARDDLKTLKKKNEAAAAKGSPVDRDAETVKQNEIFELENKLASIIYASESFIEKYNSISSQFSDETENLQRLLEDEGKSSESFEQLLEGVDWNWDRDAMLKELGAVKKDGVILGNFVLGKIFQYEGKLKDAKINFQSMTESEVQLSGAPFALYETNIWLGDNRGSKEIYEQNQKQINEYCSYIYYLNDFEQGQTF